MSVRTRRDSAATFAAAFLTGRPSFATSLAIPSAIALESSCTRRPVNRATGLMSDRRWCVLQFNRPGEQPARNRQYLMAVAGLRDADILDEGGYISMVV